MVNEQTQAVGAILLPTSENTRCEKNTQSYWRAITGIQAHKACLLLRSEFPRGSNKKQIFVSETPLVFNYSHLYLLLTFFWDETLYLTVYPSSEQSYDRFAEPRIFQEINLASAFLLFSTLFFKKRNDAWKEINYFPTLLNIIAIMILRKHAWTHLDHWSWKSCVLIQNKKMAEDGKTEAL